MRLQTVRKSELAFYKPACGSKLINISIIVSFYVMRGSRKFCQSGSNFDGLGFFLVDGGREDPNSTINGPSSARKRNDI